MTTTLYQTGDFLDYSNAGIAISAGDVVTLTDRIGIAVEDIAASTGKGSLQVEGVHKLDATAAETWTQGEVLYWNDSTDKLTEESSGTVGPVGYAAYAKASGATTGYVKLTG